MKEIYQSELALAKDAVAIATNVFNEATEDFVDAAIYELLAAELRLKQLLSESKQRA